MAETIAQTISNLLRPWWVRAVGALVGTLSFYDVCSNQFGWVKIPRLWGMTGSLLPWWGWLLVLQTVFIAALFEYVRRNTAPLSTPLAPYNDTAIRAEITQVRDELVKIDNRLKAATNQGELTSKRTAELQGKLAPVFEQFDIDCRHRKAMEIEKRIDSYKPPYPTQSTRVGRPDDQFVRVNRLLASIGKDIQTELGVADYEMKNADLVAENEARAKVAGDPEKGDFSGQSHKEAYYLVTEKFEAYRDLLKQKGLL